MLVVGLDGVHALLPCTLMSQIDSLLQSARIDDAIELTDQAKKKLDMPGAVADPEQVRLYSYLLLHSQLMGCFRWEGGGDTPDVSTDRLQVSSCHSIPRRR